MTRSASVPVLAKSAAARYHSALTAGMVLAGTRSLRDGPTVAELLLEDGLAQATRPALTELYRRPIEAGLLRMMEQSRDEITRAVLAYYRERPDVVAPARGVLESYTRRGFNLGGQMGLEELGLYGLFELTDETIANRIDDHVGRLVNPHRQARLSVVVTTAEEIGGQVSRQRDEGLSAADMLPMLSAWILGRTVIRSANIAVTESVRMTRWGMLSAFAGNGIHGVRHECALDVDQRCPSGACPALCGTEYELGGVFNPMGGIPGAGQIPVHPACRCWYAPLQDGWLKPALVWTGFALSALGD